MATSYTPGQGTFVGLLPEPETSRLAFLMSGGINVAIAVTAIMIGMTAQHVLQQHYEMTELVVPNTPPPPAVKIRQPPPQELPPPPEPPKVELQPRQIEMPKPKPEPKPIQMEAKVNLPVVQPKPQTVVMQPQPKAALTAAMPAQNNDSQSLHRARASGRDLRRDAQSQCHPAGDGGRDRQSLWRHAGPGGGASWRGGINRHRQRHQVRLQRRYLGRVAPRVFPEPQAPAPANYGRVGSAGIPGMTQAAAAPQDEYAGGPLHRSLKFFQAAGAVHQRSAATADPRRRGSACDFPGQRAGGGARRGSADWATGSTKKRSRVAQQIRFRPATQ